MSFRLLPSSTMHVLEGVSSTAGLLAWGFISILTLRVLYRWWSGTNGSGLPYPPGPKGYPVINNFFDMPMHKEWEVYRDLSKKYGDIMFFRVFNTPIMILSSQKVVLDLFEKRSAIYSARPHSVMMHDLLSMDNFFSLLTYGPWWRRHRRAFHQNFYPNAIPKYRYIITKYTSRLLVSLYNGGDMDESARNAIAGIGIRILYGVDVKSVTDPFISDAIEVSEAFAEAATPGRFMVDNLPILKYVPSWVPGAGFQRWAQYYKQVCLRVLDEPFNFVQLKHEKAEAVPCVATTFIDKFPEGDTQERHEEYIIARNVVSQSHLAAVDTTHSVACAFYLGVLTNPSIQASAQAELDRVVGHGVVPDVSQAADLPYVSAIAKESLRWHQVLPLGFPHLVSEDHVYNGYFIPKGTIAFGNAWGMMHDPQVFDEPMSFNPEHYLRKDDTGAWELDPNAVEPNPTFGFGRRICPGRYLAFEMLFSVVAASLAMFNILPPEDEHGNPEKLPEARFATRSAMMRPEPFRCIFKPRSAQTEATLENLKASLPFA
ncbi:hypothetical protein D9611_010868 [Ephemerocybe angulata]|uniref:Cytochrome P450 n=1 Tax=Ephemerocybe angulata TaxID=980116 RepID=A0A8H5C516_9AGAR|nr:hypothetical protein D9611_010868 [Tulosesus angulatus]